MPKDRFLENFGLLEEEVIGRLERDGVAEADRSITYTLEMRYGVQVHTVQLDIERDTYLAADFDKISSEFDAGYDKLYGKGSGYADAGRFVTGFIVKGYGQLPIPERAARNGGAKDATAALAGSRQAYFGSGFQDSAIYRYDALEAGNEIHGPAVIEAAETTIVVPPSRVATVDPYLNVRIRTGSANGGAPRV
jgi:N-methylhydantoinase A